MVFVNLQIMSMCYWQIQPSSGSPANMACGLLYCYLWVLKWLCLWEIDYPTRKKNPPSERMSMQQPMTQWIRLKIEWLIVSLKEKSKSALSGAFFFVAFLLNWHIVDANNSNWCCSGCQAMLIISFFSSGATNYLNNVLPFIKQRTKDATTI